ncbi:putative serine carboxypeptidase [Xylogone sp. PMI_703]|nr:putative serine carboxypeptidase [Xylogone sp. PMI_703]
MATSAALLLTLAASTAVAQFVPPPTDLTTAIGNGVQVRYKEVPTGICELDPNVKSYAGYADVSENEHIFWWFFEARNGDPKDAPLTIWINGGPGSSSMIGLFQENGPCGIDINGNVVNNPYSWSNITNMLYIDQPTQTGFSYSIPIPGYQDPDSGDIIGLPNNTCPDYAQDWDCGTYSLPDLTLTANSTIGAAPNFYKTLQGFMGVFDKYTHNGVHLTTESYGGHYGPIFGEYINQQNDLSIPGTRRINLKSVSIGNGWIDPLIQYPAYYNFTVSPGNTYDYSPFNASQESEMFNNLYGTGNCYDQLLDCKAHGIDEVCAQADNFCFDYVEFLYDLYLGRDEYDMRELTPDPFPPEFYVDYLNTPEVLAAIGAFQNYTEGSNSVGAAFGSTGDDAREDGTVAAVQTLIKQGVYVTLYTGDADYICNWIGTQAVADEIAAPHYTNAGFVNITTSDGVVHGQVKQASHFAYVRIFESGHEVPFYQPLASLEMLERILAGQDIATGTFKPSRTFVTEGTKQSLYRQGNATMQFEVLPIDATYNTTLNGPNPLPPSQKKASLSEKTKQAKRRTAATRFQPHRH